jgi:hypothetical protein
MNKLQVTMNVRCFSMWGNNGFIGLCVEHYHDLYTDMILPYSANVMTIQPNKYEEISLN